MHQKTKNPPFKFECGSRVFNLLENKLPGGAGGIRTRGGLLTHTRFPGVRLKPLIHRSRTSNYSSAVPVRQAQRLTRRPLIQVAFVVCIIFMAEAISAETSVMLPGTINVVVASVATRL